MTMRGGRYLAQIVRISEIRELQRNAAEASAKKAAIAAQQALAEREGEAGKLSEVEQSWRNSLGNGLSNGLASFWSVALVEQQTSVRLAELKVTEATTSRDAKSDLWKRSMLDHDIAADLARAARKDHQRRQDEASLSDMGDLHLHRPGKTWRA